MPSSLADLIAHVHAGGIVVVDDALGADRADAVLRDVKQRIAAGHLVHDGVFAAGALALVAHLANAEPFDASGMIKAVYTRVPTLWDSFRLIEWIPAAASGGTALASAVASLRGDNNIIGDAVASLRSLCRALDAAEHSSGQRLSPAWGAGLECEEPQSALLALSPGDGTRYALHTDSGARAERKLTLLYYPPTVAAGVAGGALRVQLAGGAGTREVAPRADRLVLFNAELPHEVLPAEGTRLSLTVWGHGRGARLQPPGRALDLSHRCSSRLCQRVVNETRRQMLWRAVDVGLQIGGGGHRTIQRRTARLKKATVSP